MDHQARLRAGLAGLSAFGLVASACATDAAGERERTIVTTVSPITDIVLQVVGERFDVVGLVPEGADSHTYDPPPSAARILSDAELFIANGLFLEQPAIELAEANLPAGAEILTLANRTITRDEWVFDFSFPEREGRPNPHLWTDPLLARDYASHVLDAVVELDPVHADEHRARYEAFAARLEELDLAVAAAWETVPSEHRKLVTYHDSWPYFAHRYGLEVLAAVQPADFSEPSAADVRRIVDQVREAGVPAIFGSEVFSSDVLARIAEETGAQYVDQLRDDDLPGEPGDPDHSYIGMMTENVATMVSALGGDPSAVTAFDAGPGS
ncbi:MAG: metal ABC transporter substrate-binding protein [Nitriliruptorales bacterium]